MPNELWNEWNEKINNLAREAVDFAETCAPTINEPGDVVVSFMSYLNFPFEEGALPKDFYAIVVGRAVNLYIEKHGGLALPKRETN